MTGMIGREMNFVPVFPNKTVLRLPRPDRWYKRLPAKRMSSPLEEEWIKEVLADYGLSLTGPVKQNRKQGRSSNWILKTTGGEKILKSYNEEVDRSQILHEHSILAYLAQVNFSAPRLNATIQDRTIVEKGDQLFALFDYLDGYYQYHDHIFFPAQTGLFLTAAGQALASLHEVLKNFAPAGKNPNGFVTQSGLRWRELPWFFNYLDTCRRDAAQMQKTSVQPFNELLLRRSDWIAERLAQLDETLKEANPARVIIHGDYGPYNLLFKRGCPVVILDFELARLDWRLTDLCNSLATFAKNRVGFHQYKMKQFLEAYQSVSPVTVEEMAFLPVVWEFLSLRRLILYWRKFLDSGKVKWMAAGQERLRIVDWIHRNPDVFINLR